MAQAVISFSSLQLNLVGTFPFIDLAFAFNDKSLVLDKLMEQDREMLVLKWTTYLCVYVLQFIMGIWLLAATRECYSEYTVGNCQVWYYIAMFTFVVYIGEMGFAVSDFWKHRGFITWIPVLKSMLFHGTKIIYRAISLMIVNNFLFDICRPVFKYLSQESYMYTSYCNYRLGIPPPTRRRRLSSVTAQLLMSVNTNQPRATSSANRLPTGGPATPKLPLGYVASPPILVPSTPAPFTANRPVPIYNPTKTPLQPVPNVNFYFTYPQPKTKQYRSPYDATIPATNNYPNYYYTSINSMKPP